MWVTRLSREDASDFGDQGIGRAGLRDEPITTGVGGALQFARSIVGRQCHHRNVSGARVVLEAASGFPSIENGKTEIHKYHVGRMRGRVGQCIDAILRLYYVKARECKLLNVHLPQLELIFDEQNERLETLHASIITSLAANSPCCCARIRTSVKVNRTIQMIVSGVA